MELARAIIRSSLEWMRDRRHWILPTAVELVTALRRVRRARLWLSTTLHRLGHYPEEQISVEQVC